MVTFITFFSFILKTVIVDECEIKKENWTNMGNVISFYFLCITFLYNVYFQNISLLVENTIIIYSTVKAFQLL